MKIRLINLMDFPYTMPVELFGGVKYVIPNDKKFMKFHIMIIIKIR
jgi:hypothetical protein